MLAEFIWQKQPLQNEPSDGNQSSQALQGVVQSLPAAFSALLQLMSSFVKALTLPTCSIIHCFSVETLLSGNFFPQLFFIKIPLPPFSSLLSLEHQSPLVLRKLIIFLASLLIPCSLPLLGEVLVDPSLSSGCALLCEVPSHA